MILHAVSHDAVRADFQTPHIDRQIMLIEITNHRTQFAVTKFNAQHLIIFGGFAPSHHGLGIKMLMNKLAQ